MVIYTKKHPVSSVFIDPVGPNGSPNIPSKLIGFIYDICTYIWLICTLLGTNISHPKALLKMIFLFPRWDMLAPWRVCFMQANIPYMDLMGKLDMFNSDVMFLGFDKKKSRRANQNI